MITKLDRINAIKADREKECTAALIQLAKELQLLEEIRDTSKTQTKRRLYEKKILKIRKIVKETISKYQKDNAIDERLHKMYSSGES